MKPKPQHEAGELHRRVNAILETGVFTGLPKAAVIVFLQCRQWADFRTCRFVASVRTLAKTCKISRGGAQRGRQALQEAGILVEVPGKRSDVLTFEIRRPIRQPAVRTDRGGQARPWTEAKP